MVNRIWPTAVAGEADSVSSVSASACHVGGPNSVNTGQILLVYGTKILYIMIQVSMQNVQAKSIVQWKLDLADTDLAENLDLKDTSKNLSDHF